MITGYFYSDVAKKGSEVKQIKKILKLTIEANLIYLVWKCFYATMRQNKDFFVNTFTLKNMLKLIFVNESPLNGHLWYLGAILYVLVIVYIADKLKCGELLYWMIPVLLIGDLVLGKYAILLWNREFSYILVRNFLFVGLPYFCIGRMIRDGFGKKISSNVLLGLIALFSLTSLIERFILVNMNVNATRDHYISTTLLAVTVFLFTVRCSNSALNEENILCKLSGGGISLLTC